MIRRRTRQNGMCVDIGVRFLERPVSAQRPANSIFLRRALKG